MMRWVLALLLLAAAVAAPASAQEDWGKHYSECKKLLKEKKFAAAAAQCRKADAARPGDAGITLNLAKAYAGAGDCKLASKHAKKYQALKGAGNPEIAAILKKCAGKGGKGAKAKEAAAGGEAPPAANPPADGGGQKPVPAAKTDIVAQEVAPGWMKIVAGSFTMGSPEDEPGRNTDEKQHKVTIGRDFVMMKHEVTQKKFRELMGYDTATFKVCGTGCPTENLSWHEALAYANALSKQEGLAECFSCTGMMPDFSCGLAPAYARPQDCPGFRLPTEAEWEYAYRAGTSTTFPNGAVEDLGDAGEPLLDGTAWYFGNSAVKYAGCHDASPWGGGACVGLHLVGKKAPNAWGLYDMGGNVAEWAWDWYGEYGGDATDPVGPASGKERVVRGGSWGTYTRLLRPAARDKIKPDGRSFHTGFRLVRTIFP